MNWTITPPTKPGRYPWRGGLDLDNFVLVEVRQTNDGRLVLWENEIPVEEWGGWWAEPLIKVNFGGEPVQVDVWLTVPAGTMATFTLDGKGYKLGPIKKGPNWYQLGGREFKIVGE